MKRKITKAGLVPPKVLTLMLTNGCNLACRHCWPESISNDRVFPVPTKALKGVVEQWSRLGLEEICLTGGEPLTHPEWLEVLRFACAQEGVTRVRLQTNGTLLTQKDTENLARIEYKDILVQVSLEGDNANVHDRLRGSGSFGAAIRGIKRLVDAGMGSRTVVALTETRHNFNSVPDLLKCLANMGVGSLVTGTLVQEGRSLKNPWLSPPTPDQYVAILRLYHENGEFRKEYEKMANIACLEWWLGKDSSKSETCSCFERPYVTAEGLLYPCIMLPVDHLAVSGVHDAPLEETLIQAVSKWSHLPELIRKRKRHMAACKRCPGQNHCEGGCMGRAYGAHKDFMSVEDRCALRKAVYAWHP